MPRGRDALLVHCLCVVLKCFEHSTLASLALFVWRSQGFETHQLWIWANSSSQGPFLKAVEEQMGRYGQKRDVDELIEVNLFCGDQSAG